MQPELACPKFQKEMETFDIFITWKISWEKKVSFYEVDSQETPHFDFAL